MIPANSIHDVLHTLQQRLPRTVTVTTKELVHEVGLMRAFDEPRPPRFKTTTSQETLNSCLVGLLFCTPDGPIAKGEIVPHLNYFHHRSGEAVDFYCVGYGAYWPPGSFSDQRDVVKIDDVTWQYSDQAFTQTTSEFEAATSWEENGEASLILLVARRRENGEVALDYSTAIVCNLEQMIKDHAVSSVRAFFNSVFKYAAGSGRSTLALSDRAGVAVAKGVLRDGVLSLLPKSVGEKFNAAQHFAVRDISKEA